MNAANPEATIVNMSFKSIVENEAKFYAKARFMKTYINISNVPVEVAEKVKAIAESEFDGNESAAYRKLLAEALEARAKKAKKGA